MNLKEGLLRSNRYIKEKIQKKFDALNEMTVSKIFFDEWEEGRRLTEASNKVTYSSAIYKMPATIYFDSEHFRMSIIRCNADGSIKSGLSWNTAGMIEAAPTGQYTHFWLEVQHANGTGDITGEELNIIKSTTYMPSGIESPLINTVENLQKETSEQKNQIAKKVGYSEVENGKLMMYADESKAILLAILDLPTSGNVKINGVETTDNNVPIIAYGQAGVLGGISQTFGIYANGNGFPYIAQASNGEIDAKLSPYRPITPANLEYAVTSVVDFETGEAESVTFLEPSDLEHYVKDTDLISATNAGIAKVYSGYGSAANSAGVIHGVTRTEAQYNNDVVQLLISKGTLENIKESLVKSVMDMKLIAEVTIEEDVQEVSIDISESEKINDWFYVIYNNNAKVIPNTTAGGIRIDIQLTATSGFKAIYPATSSNTDLGLLFGTVKRISDSELLSCNSSKNNGYGNTQEFNNFMPNCLGYLKNVKFKGQTTNLWTAGTKFRIFKL